MWKTPYCQVSYDLLICPLDTLEVTQDLSNLPWKSSTLFRNQQGSLQILQNVKCNFGGINEGNRMEIMTATSFAKGPLPFRYLRVPLTSRKLAVQQCMPLIDKIILRVRYQSERLLSFAERMQLIQSVIFATTNYWMLRFPVPKKVIHKIEVICRSFMWSGWDETKRISPVKWKKVCSPKKKGVMNLILWLNGIRSTWLNFYGT